MRLFPGARVNLSKRGASISVGRRGAWLTAGHGRVRETLGVPGTGLSWYETQRVGRSSHALLFLLIAGVVLYLFAR